MSETTVREVLKSKGNTRVWTIDSKDSVFVAIHTMATHNIGALLVTCGSQIVGVISERDYARKVILKNYSSKSLPVDAVMTEDVVFVEPSDTVNFSMALMTKHCIRHLPVLENGRLLGLISMGDIVKAMLTDRDFLIDQLTSYITGSSHVSNVYQLDKRQAEKKEAAL